MQDLWSRYQEWLYFNPALDFFLDVSRVRFGDDLLLSLGPAFERAFDDMADLESGSVANPDENRMDGHYWLRNPDLCPSTEVRQSILTVLADIETFSRAVQDGRISPPEAPRFTDVLMIGIGGSALGPQFVASALAPDRPLLAIHFIDNTDLAGIDRVLADLFDRLDSTLVIDTSKSGGTPEPRNGMLEVRHVYNRRGLDFPRHAVAITMPGSHMDRLAQEEHWLAEFPMHDWVGGRTSELSAVGLLPAALQGIDIRLMLSGASAMDDATRQRDIRQNPAALLALCWYHTGGGKGTKDMVVLPYKDSLLLFSRYLQQLVMESLGKERDLDGNVVQQGIAVYGNKGSTDQHAYVQQLREGVPNFFATFIEVLEDRIGESIEVEEGATSGDFLSGFLLGTRSALYENQRDSITITIPQVNPRTVGALIALYERSVGLYASLVNINAYHQPGVEAGKKAAEAILDLQRRVLLVLENATKPLAMESIAEAAGADDQVETVYQIIRHLAANQRGVILQGNASRPASQTVSLQRTLQPVVLP